jgi:hypothetical protein
MLGDEDRVVSHGGLLAVVGGFRGRQTPLDEVLRVGEDGLQSLLLEVRRLPAAQSEPAAELRSLQCLEQFVQIAHGGLRRDADDRHADDAFLHVIHVDQRIHLVVEQGVGR